MATTVNNKVVFITGGNSGIGLATAQLFSAQGAKVVLTGRSLAALDNAALTLTGESLAVRADVTSLADLDAAFEQAAARFGKIDFLIANAGIGRFGPIETTTEEAYDEQMDINVKGTYFTVQRALPYLNKPASVVLFGSFLSRVGVAQTSVLTASKAANSALARTLAAELAPAGIRVNVLSPGYIATPLLGKAGLSPEVVNALAQNAIASTPLGRFGSADEMAKAVLFLASDDSSYLVGTDLLADGGVVYA